MHKKHIFILITLLILVFTGVVSLTILATSAQQLVRGSQELKRGQELLLSNPQEASTHFSRGQAEVEKASTVLRRAPWYTKLLTPLPPFRWQVQLIKASHALAESGEIVSQLSSSFPELSKETDISLLLSKQSAEYFTWYQANRQQVLRLEDELILANRELEAVPNWVLPGNTAELTALKNTVRTTSFGVPHLRNLSDNLQVAFGKGDPNPRQFLVVFQNDAELRPGGGFIGSYATLTASSGMLRSYSFGKDIYLIDRPYEEAEKIASSKPYLTISPYYGFRDSNTQGGFRDEIGTEVARMYQVVTRGSEVSGVIFVDTTVVEKILDLTGPILLPRQNREITSANLNTELVQYVEEDFYTKSTSDRPAEPKQIINELIPVLLQKLQTTPAISTKLPEVLRDRVAAKSIQFWSRDTALSNQLTTLQPLDAPTGKPWIKIVNSNIGGLKSSRSIEQTTTIQRVPISTTRRDTYRVTIERRHTGTGQWPDSENANFTEVYVPSAATQITLPKGRGGQSKLTPTLRSSLGISDEVLAPSVSEGKNWKKISFWSTTSVNEKTSYVFEFSLPRRVPLFSEGLLYLKQAGAQRETVISGGKEYTVDKNLYLRP